MGTERTVINAIIGAVIGVVLSFIPFSTVLGGAVAGFLEGPSPRDGAIVGALSGLITFLPIAGITVVILGVLGFGMGVASAPVSGFAAVVVVVLALAFIVFFYTVGLSLLGGYLGAYLAEEYPDQRAQTRDTIGLSSPTGRRGSGRSKPVDPTQPTKPRSDSSRETDRDRVDIREPDRGPNGDREPDRDRS